MPISRFAKGRASTLLRQQLLVGLLIALLLSFMTSNSAQAALTTTTATINGSTSFSAFPGEQLAISMQVGYTSDTDWRSTQFRFATSGSYTCEDSSSDGHPQFNNSGSGTNTALLYIPAPTSAGTYTLQVRPLPNSDCSGTAGATAANITVTVGSYPSTASNPNLGEFCGLNVILVLDESTSIYTTSGATADVREAAVEFLTGLNNTGSSVAIVEFNTLARQAFGYTVVNDTNLTSLLNYVNDGSGAPQGGYEPPSGGGYTNWDDAFQKVEDLNRTMIAPLVIFITDGDPTTYGDGRDRDTSTTFGTNDERMTHAVAASNRLKAQGSHILAVGVGASLNNTASLGRLKQISGNDVYPDTALNMSTTDVLRVSNFGDLDTAMRSVVTALCQSSVSVTKRVDPGTGTYAVASGWQFSARVRYPQPTGTSFTWLTPSGPAPATVVSSNTDANGVVNFQWRPTTTNSLSTIIITETQQSGYTLDSFVCTKTSGTGTPAYSLNGTAMTISNISYDAVITCDAKNRALPATLIVKKVVVNDNGGTKTANNFTFQVNGGTATAFQADGQNDLTVNAGTYNVTEPAVTGYTTTYSGCSAISIPNGGTATCTITNNDNAPSLTLVKQVTNDNGGIATPSQWTLTATGPTTFSGAGPSVASNASFDAGTYTLSESGGPTGYTAGSWSCVGVTPSGSQITLTLGQSATCTIINNDNVPSLSLVKLATPTTYSVVGANIHYSYTLTNNGTVTLKTPYTVSDNKATVTCPNTPATLAPTTSVVCSANYSITQADIDAGSVTNIATATARDPSGNPVNSNPDTETVTAVKTPALTLVKLATPTTYSTVGANIHYSYTLTNSGNVTLKTPYAVTDNKATVTCPNTPATLVPNASVVCSANYTITQADLDAGFVTNLATATAKDPTNSTVTSNPDTETVTAVKTPALTLVKLATPTTYAAVGANIHYSYTLTNSGNVTLKTPYAVTDNKATVTCPNTSATLVPNASVVCSANYTITQADLDAGFVTNLATATAKDPTDGTVTSNPDTETVTAVKEPDILITKKATQANFDAPGDVISYTLIATNTGNVSLSNVRITDPKISVLGCTPTQPTTLAPGARITCTGSYTVTLGDVNAGKVDNTAKATGTPPTGPDVEDTDDETVPAVQTPSIVITKKATQANYNEPGDVIDYTLVATNTGNVSLSGVTISDPKLSALSCTPTQPTTLVPGAHITCTGSYTVTLGDVNAGKVDNTAKATGTPPTGPDVEDTDDETVPAIQTPGIVITKQATQANFDAPGDVIDYTLVATNTGNVSLSGVTISDPKLSALSCTPTQPTTLVPGAHITCTGSYTVTLGDVNAGKVDNTAKATGTPPTGPDVEDTDDETVPAIQTPGIVIVKQATQANFDAPGDVIDYTLVATNTGNITLHNVTISDPKLGTLSCTPTQPTTLLPGTSMTCTGSYTVVQSDVDAGKVDNTATTDSDETEPDTDDETVPGVPGPELDIDKTGDAGPVTIGDTVHYTITVRNTGNVTIKDVTVTDAKIGIIQNVGTLSVGQTAQVTGSYGPVTEADLPGPIFNTAGVTGTTPIDTPVPPVTDTHTVPVTFTPALAIDKTGTAGPVTIGDTVRYTITVQNTGNVTLTNVTVTDNKLGIIQNVGTLTVGQTAQVLGSYGPVVEADLPGPIFNTAGVTGTTPINTPVPPVTDTHTVPVVDGPALEIIKTGDAGPVTIGDTVHYTITVRNTGNVTLKDVTVTDAKLGIIQNVGTLAVGQTAQITGNYGPVTEADLPGPIFNTAGVTGTTPIDTSVPPVTDTHTVPVTMSPKLTLVKTASPTTYKAVGETINYTYKLTNDGNVTLKAPFTVSDDKTTVTCPAQPTTLAVGESITCTASYVNTQPDLVAGSVTNVAQAKAKDPNNNDVTSNEDDETVTREDLPGTLGDKVWRDDNKNGLQDADELGAEGVKVDLYKEDGTFVATQTTDSNGGYLFTGLEEGSYYVQFTAPQDFSYSPANVFNNEADTIDSDAEMAWVEIGLTNGSIEEAELGAPLTYTIYYTNTDLTRAATNIVISTLVPVGTTFADGSEGWVCEGGNIIEGTVCTLTVATLPANTSGTATFTVLLGEDEVAVPDELGFSVKVSHGVVARSQTVTLGLGAVNRSLDAGLVHMDASVVTATPPAATNLPETEQPQQRNNIFLPSLRLSDTDASSNSVAPQAASQQETNESEDVAQSNSTFLPTVESSE